MVTEGDLTEPAMLTNETILITGVTGQIAFPHAQHLAGGCDPATLAQT